MPTDQNNDWLSCYLFYKGSADKVLTDIVWPFVKHAEGKEQIEGFFFIRYDDERGPHIRLRLKPSEGTLTTNLKRLCRAAFGQVRFIKYVPELRRYGGSEGVKVAERLFEASSVAILRRMTEANTWSYGQALGTALQLHLGMASGLGLSREETAELFGHIASHYHQGDAAKVTYLSENLRPQRSSIKPSLVLLWEKCGQDAEFKEQWFTEWRREMQNIKDSLRRLQDNKQLRIPKQTQHKRNPLWYVYESYIHMTNNRLGLSRHDESFAAYIIEQALKES